MGGGEASYNRARLGALLAVEGSVIERTAYRRMERGEGQAGLSDAVFSLGLWLICAAGFAGLAMRAGERAVRYQPDASQRLPQGLEYLAYAQGMLAEPRTLAAALVALAAVLLLRGARMESLTVLATFVLFGTMVAIKHMVFDVPPVLTQYGAYEGLFGAHYGFPSGQIVGLAVLGGLVFVFAERLLPDVLDAWFLRLAAFVLIASPGLLGLYQGAYGAEEVLANYLLVALFLIPVAAGYGRDERDGSVAGSVLIETKPARTGRGVSCWRALRRWWRRSGRRA